MSVNTWFVLVLIAAGLGLTAVGGLATCCIATAWPKAWIILMAIHGIILLLCIFGLVLLMRHANKAMLPTESTNPADQFGHKF